MGNTTIAKAITAFLTSAASLFVAVGIVLPGWFTPELYTNIGYFGAFVFSLIGGSFTGWLTWLIPNKPK